LILARKFGESRKRRFQFLLRVAFFFAPFAFFACKSLPTLIAALAGVLVHAKDAKGRRGLVLAFRRGPVRVRFTKKARTPAQAGVQTWIK
jgi:hypothetical protein